MYPDNRAIDFDYPADGSSMSLSNSRVFIHHFPIEFMTHELGVVLFSLFLHHFMEF
ncbi:Uncharacterised protein [Legionella pneumophila]|nr:Uncharacterised protein [Legionella pneumophila]CZJ10055.1 Uncharacterised protein [Legionella pneumophila]CZJ27787.1 Uncharacterised protein [Legionella pneumophila]CZJ33045.1 Uncharacterised protein [Legionella pneumophila]